MSTTIANPSVYDPDATITGQATAAVTASGAIAAGSEVQVGANGQAVTKAAGVAVGYAITGAADATDAEISLY